MNISWQTLSNVNAAVLLHMTRLWISVLQCPLLANISQAIFQRVLSISSHSNETTKCSFPNKMCIFCHGGVATSEPLPVAALMFGTPLLSSSSFPLPGQFRIYSMSPAPFQRSSHIIIIWLTLIVSFFKPLAFLFSDFPGIKNVSPGHICDRVGGQRRFYPHLMCASFLV